LPKLKEHRFFKGIDWKSLLKKEIEPPPAFLGIEESKNKEPVFII